MTDRPDRRPIDPPPIVQLIVRNPPSTSQDPRNKHSSYLQNPYYFMHASLIEKDSRAEVNLIRDDQDLDKDKDKGANLDFEDSGNESGFFVFPDLSVRMEGTYRLKFCLYEMTGTQVHFCTSIVSAPLVVYSAKKFPGMEESTTLSQFFAEQGLKIRIRKEVRPKKRARAGYAREVTFETPKQGKDFNDPSESTEEDDSRTVDRTSKRIAIPTEAHWRDVQDVTDLTEIPEDEEEYRRSRATDRYPGEGPPNRGPEHPLDYLDPYDRLGPDYDPAYSPPSPNSRRYGRSQHDRSGGDRYDRALGSYPADERWPPHYMYPGYYYFYYPPPRGYPDPYLRRFDPRYPHYPPPRAPIPYPYLPPEFLARGMAPYPYPPNFRSYHGQEVPYPPPPFPSAGQRAPGGSDFYPNFPYAESYPPPDQDPDLQHYYPPDPYGPPRQPPSGNSSSSSSSSQAPHRAYPHPPYPHGYLPYPPYDLPRGGHPEDEEMSESTRPSTSTSDQQDYHRSAMSQYHYPDRYRAMDSFKPLVVEPESTDNAKDQNLELGLEWEQEQEQEQDLK
ncbi:hypothetical protein BG003_005759 [Podila horticola]|nr:hypothetical protein BG003_005759 [Podila horticola]